MSVNSSPNSSLHSPLDDCLQSRKSISVFTALFISYILLLPLYILILYMGYQQWRKQRSGATAAKMSHSDIFTFNMVVLELIILMALCSYCIGTHTNQPVLIIVGISILSIITPGESLFHLLTCVERYLAVVHPVTYMGLRQSGGVRIRNISILCVWLFCFASVGINSINFYVGVIYNFLSLGLSCFVVVFCSLSVLCILIRPGPGEVGGKRERLDQSKQRAFHTIVAIMAALLLRFFSDIVSHGISVSSLVDYSESCLMWISFLWLSLPSSLVLPLLFLQRAGKLPDCKRNAETGSG